MYKSDKNVALGILQKYFCFPLLSLIYNLEYVQFTCGLIVTLLT